LRKCRHFPQVKAEVGQAGADRVQVLADHCARYRIDGEIPVLMGLRVLADPLAVLDKIVEGKVKNAAFQINITGLQPAEFTRARSSYRGQP
jgi:hypothetical protein